MEIGGIMKVKDFIFHQQARRIWQTVNLLLGEEKSKAAYFVDGVNFVEKKASEIRESTASADDPVFTDTEASRMFDFNQSTRMTCSPKIRLLKDSATISGPHILLIVNTSISLNYHPAGLEACHRVFSPQESRCQCISTGKLSTSFELAVSFEGSRTCRVQSDHRVFTSEQLTPEASVSLPAQSFHRDRIVS